MIPEDERLVRAVPDQVEAWHDRTHHSVAGTFALCMFDPCASVQRGAATGRRERHLRPTGDR